MPDGAVSLVAKEQGTAATESSRTAATESSRSAGECLKGKLGKGRHGGQLERNMICAHMRAQKRDKKSRQSEDELLAALGSCQLVKNGVCFSVAAKPTRAGGIRIILTKAAGRGNRYVRKVAFAKFLRASFGLNTSNVALAAVLGLDSSTIPRLQKTCAGTFMIAQARVLARICSFYQREKPLTVHEQLKYDETTVSTTLNPGEL